jgi:hypothetical protein
MQTWQRICGLCFFVAVSAFCLYQVWCGLTAGAILGGLKNNPRWIEFNTEPAPFLFGFAIWTFAAIAFSFITYQTVRQELLIWECSRSFEPGGREPDDGTPPTVPPRRSRLIFAWQVFNGRQRGRRG